MTHVVARGPPTPAQEYLEKIIQELIAETGRQKDRYSFTRILFKVLRDNPDRVFMVEGTSGVSIKNSEVLKGAVTVAKALTASGVQRGDTACFVSWNSVQFAKAFYGCLFAGVVINGVVDFATSYEICNCLKTTRAKIIFAEQTKVKEVQVALKESQLDCMVVVLNCDIEGDRHGGMEYTEYCRIHNGICDINSYLPAETEPDDVMTLTLTSGSTGIGLPKLAMNTYSSFVAQAASPWAYDEVPQPTRMIFLIYSAQWMAHIFTFSAYPIFGVTLLVQSQSANAENMLYCVKTYKPTQVYMVPTQVTNILTHPKYTRGDLYSLDTFCVMGSASSSTSMSRLKAELREDAVVLNRYAMTESTSFICLSRKGTTPPSVGLVNNIYQYKIVDEQGNKVTIPNKYGELRLKSDYAVAKGYLNAPEATADMRDEDGWFCTGDILYQNEHNELYFQDRKKFIILYNDYPILPAEIEHVVGDVEGVISCAVCGVAAGPLALVVCRPGADVTEQQIKDAVKEKLNVFKQLTGGVFFVKALPTSHNGKIIRIKCKELAERLLAERSASN